MDYLNFTKEWLPVLTAFLLFLIIILYYFYPIYFREGIANTWSFLRETFFEPFHKTGSVSLDPNYWALEISFLTEALFNTRWQVTDRLFKRRIDSLLGGDEETFCPLELSKQNTVEARSEREKQIRAKIKKLKNDKRGSQRFKGHLQTEIGLLHYELLKIRSLEVRYPSDRYAIIGKLSKYKVHEKLPKLVTSLIKDLRPTQHDKIRILKKEWIHLRNSVAIGDIDTLFVRLHSLFREMFKYSAASNRQHNHPKTADLSFLQGIARFQTTPSQVDQRNAVEILIETTLPMDTQWYDPDKEIACYTRNTIGTLLFELNKFEASGSYFQTSLKDLEIAFPDQAQLLGVAYNAVGKLFATKKTFKAYKEAYYFFIKSDKLLGDLVKNRRKDSVRDEIYRRFEPKSSKDLVSESINSFESLISQFTSQKAQFEDVTSTLEVVVENLPNSSTAKDRGLHTMKVIDLISSCIAFLKKSNENTKIRELQKTAESLIETYSEYLNIQNANNEYNRLYDQIGILDLFSQIGSGKKAGTARAKLRGEITSSKTLENDLKDGLLKKLK